MDGGHRLLSPLSRPLLRPRIQAFCAPTMLLITRSAAERTIRAWRLDRFADWCPPDETLLRGVIAPIKYS